MDNLKRSYPPSDRRVHSEYGGGQRARQRSSGRAHQPGRAHARSEERSPRSYRDGYALPEARRPRRNINPNEERRRAQRRAYLRRKKQRARMTLFLVIVSFFMFLYLSFRGLAGILNYIENSRELQRGETEMIETEGSPMQDHLSENIPSLAAMGPGDALSGEAAPVPAAADIPAGESVGSGSDDGSADSMDPSHILSGGRYIDSTKPMIALTFDDGPKTDVDNQLTSALEAVDGRATFFIVGQRAAGSAAHIKDMSDRGHEIANHSWDHDTKMNKKSSDYVRDEFSKADAAIEAATGKEVAVYRLPGGNISDSVRSAIQKPMIYWSIDTLDWKNRNADSVISAVRGHVKDGDIILMHALYQSTADACKTLIPELHAQGYQFVTVSELIALRGEGVSGGNGKQYSKFPPLAKPAETTAPETSPAESSMEAVAEPGSPEESSHPSADTVLVGPGAAVN